MGNSRDQKWGRLRDRRHWFGANDSNGPFRTWSYDTNNLPGFSFGAGLGQIDDQSWARGLYVWNDGAKAYTAGQFGQWLYGAYRESFIYRMDLAGIHHRPYGTCLYRGLYNACQAAWQTSFYSGPYWASSPVSWCGFEGGGSETHCAAAGCAPAAPTGNVAVWGVMAYPHNGVRGDFTGYVGAATMFLSDDNNPTITPVVAPPAGWTRGGDLVWSYATDPGLGMKRIRLTSPGNPSWSSAVDYDTACTFSATNRCGETAHAYTYLNDLPDGIQTLRTEAWDIIDRPSGPRDSTVKIDRSGPELRLDGPLWTSQSAPLTQESYDLDFQATDGSTTGASAQRSGVKSVEITVDGQSVYLGTQETDTGACPPAYLQGSCPLTDSWSFPTEDYAAGAHTVTVVAEDQLGQRSVPRTFTVTVPTRPSTGEPVDDVQEDVDVDAVVRESETSFGDRYAGAYIDDESPGRPLKVLVTNPSPHDEVTLRQISNGNLKVVLDAAARPLSLLTSVRSLVSEVVQGLGIPAAIGIDEPSQTVLVMSEPLVSAVRERLAALGPLGVVQFEESTDFEVLQSGCRSCYPPYEAGKEVRVGGSRCTSGFLMAAGGNRYGTTAGHCGGTGSRVSIGGRYISNIGSNAYAPATRTRADAARFFVPSDKAQPDVFTGGDRAVQGAYSNRALQRGTALCFQGRASGANNCDKVRL